MTSKSGAHTGREIDWPERKTRIVIAHLLGAGGEGEVYAVKNHGDLAVKIYHEDRRPTGHMAQKLLAMENQRPNLPNRRSNELPRLAWPTKIIRMRGEEKVTGLVMPLVDRERTQPISYMLNPVTRRISLPKRNLTEAQFQGKKREIARNIITAVKALHQVECVIGDVNDDNILVDPANGEISIVDCDAFQVTDRKNRTIHRCKVGREQFTAPELLQELDSTTCRSTNCRKRRETGEHAPSYECLKREPDHDMFGIGVILFKLFMNGAHPYNQRVNPATGSTATLKGLIASRSYPYDERGPRPSVTPTNQALYQSLPADIKTMFLKTFR